MNGYAEVQSPIVPATGLQNLPDVNEASGTQRERDTYSAEETALLDRCAQMLTRHGDKIQIRCGATLCSQRVVKIEPDSTVETGAVLGCGCTVRILQRNAGRSNALAKAAARRLRRGQKRIKR